MSPARSRPFRIALIGLVVLISGAAGGIFAFRAWSGARLIAQDPDVEAQTPAVMRTAVSSGHATFIRYCASCHGRDGQGDRRGVPSLADKDWLYGVGKASEIERVILHGIRAPDPKTWNLADMPAFASPHPYPRESTIKPLTPQDIRDTVEFLLSIEGQRANEDSAVRGQAIFNDRGGCYDCHGNDTRGDSEIGGPNLSDSIWLYGGDRESIFRSIALGRSGHCPAWAAKLDRVTIRRAALYVYSLSHRLPAKGAKAS